MWKIHSIKRTDGVAGQVAIVAEVQWSGEAPATVIFTGSIYGEPGPIRLTLRDGVTTIPVSEPARFDQTFDTDWVRGYYS